MKKYLRAIGLSSLVKGFVVFFVYGFLLTLYIEFVHGLESDVPDSVSSLLNGPLSLHLFGALALFGLSFFFIVTKFFPKEVDLENHRPKRIYWFALPVCECAIALGIVIVGFLFGSAIAAAGVFFTDFTSVDVYKMLFALSFAMLLYTLPIMYFTLLMLDTEGRIKTYLDVSAGLYFITVVVLLIIGLPASDLFEIGILLSLFMLVLRIYHKPLVKKVQIN
jgi:hypothetical protein